MTFRDRLLRSLERMQPVLDVAGVMVGGSQVPNLLQKDAKASLVVSQDIDLIVPVASHAEVRHALESVKGYASSSDEPSVWLPDEPSRLEINFIGRDPKTRETNESYVIEDSTLPLLVFGLLGFLHEGKTIEASGVRIPLPRPAGLLVEKLLTERAGLKGERDLLVALGLLMLSSDEDLQETQTLFHERLSADARVLVLSSLAVLSLMRPHPGMPDPTLGRDRVEGLLSLLRTPER